MYWEIGLSLLTILVLTSPSTADDCLVPTLKGEPTLIGIVEDPTLNRDSCGSVVLGNRALWVCRDTNPFDSPSPIICNSASWTDLTRNGSGRDRSGTSLIMYGFNNSNWKSYYPLVPGNCNENEAGECSDGTRYPHWQDTPPLITYEDSRIAVGYTFVPNHQIVGLAPLVPDPSTVLYRITHRYDNNDPIALPLPEIVDGTFWPEAEINYGVYGSLVSGSMAYLYSKDNNWNVAIARVPVDRVESKNSYEFYVGGNWTREKPQLGDNAAKLENISGLGQGTFYYSEHWRSFVWIGQAAFSVSADFFITTAPNPEGPWCQPQKFWSGVNGNATLPAYTIQAHPGLVDKAVNEMYLTYTKVDNYIKEDGDMYTTPLIRVEWE